nr:MAG TPA: hypothetical protein [Caudoviricetes sp.]
MFKVLVTTWFLITKQRYIIFWLCVSFLTIIFI